MGLLVIFSAFVWANIRDAKQSISQRDPHSRRDISRRRVFIMTCKFILGVVGIIVGSELLINEGSAIAVFLGVPASIIGVTMVAVGTSLPELVTTVSAIVKRESSMSIGNIIGANVIDLTMILPVCSLISGGRLAISPQTVLLDLPGLPFAGGHRHPAPAVHRPVLPCPGRAYAASLRGVCGAFDFVRERAGTIPALFCY